MTSITKEPWEEEFDKLLYEPEHVGGVHRCWCGVEQEVVDGVLHIHHKPQRVVIRDFIRKNLLSQKNELVEDINGYIVEVRNRYRCAACDGAKCEHTFACKSFTDIIDLINKKP